MATGRLVPGETGLHPIPLEQGEYVEIHLDRSTREARLRLLAAAGEGEAAGTVGAGEHSADPPGQSLWALAPESGVYQVAVRPASGDLDGPYRLRVLALHPAGPRERARQAGQVAWEKGLSAQGRERHEEALEHLDAAYRSWSEAGYLRGTAAVLTKIGRSRRALRQLPEAAETFRRAASEWNLAGDPTGVAGALNLLADVEVERHRWTQARESLAEGFEAADAAGANEAAGNLLETVCKLHVRRGETQAAIRGCRRSVEHWRNMGRTEETVDSLTNLGVVHRRLGELDEARRYYQEALANLEGHPDPEKEAVLFNNLATLHYFRGELQQALVDYQHALRLRERTGDREGAAFVLYNMGSIKEQVGSLEETLRYYREARRIQEAIGETEDLVLTLFGIGWVHLRNDRPDLAREPLEKALSVSRESGAAPSVGTALHGMAELHLKENRPSAALESLDEALQIERATGNRWNQARLLRLVAEAEEKLGDQDRALQALRSAVTINEDIRNRRGLAANHYDIARILRGRGRIDEAREAIEQALAVADLLREQTGGHDFRSRVAASHQPLYDLFIDLLMEQHARNPNGGHAAEALREAERARARILLEVLSGTDLGLDRIPSDLAAERQTLRRRLAELERRREHLLREDEGGEETTELFRVRLDLDQVVLGLAEVERRMREENPDYALLTRPQAVSVGEIRRFVVDPETVLLEFRLGDERSFLFTVGEERFDAFELPGREVLEQEARCLHWLITAFGEPTGSSGEDRWHCLGDGAAAFRGSAQAGTIEERDRRRSLLEAAYQRRAQRLAALLLGRAREAGALAARRLAVVADGALVYVPFGALPDPAAPERFLLASHEVVHLPSASVLAFQRRRSDRKRDPSDVLAVLADPIYSSDDVRVHAAGGSAPEPAPVDRGSSPEGSSPRARQFRRLAFSAEEAESILAFVDPDAAFVGLGEAASREAVAGPALRDYRYVHFATHGIVDTAYPRLSGLVLSLLDESGWPREDGFLRLDDVYGMQLNADMVVLSACDTALGREVRGEGLIGLARGFMYAGAERVVASLWRANDRTTANLMESLYRNLLVEERPPGDALRRAQLDLMTDPEGDFGFPYYWAGFTLQGDWR